MRIQNKKNMTQIAVLLLIMTYLLVVGIGAINLLSAMGAQSAQSTGSFQINAGPGAVTSVDFQDDSYTPVAAVDPDASTWWRLNFTITMSSGIKDIDNITIWIFDDSDHGANYNTTSATGTTLVEYNWINSSDTWSIVDQGSLTGWTIDSPNSNDPGTGSSETTYEFSMRFQISRCADYDTDWNATVHAYDGDTPAEVGYGAESALITMNQYFEVQVSSGSFSWGTTVVPDSTNNTHGALTLTIWGNDNWEIEINQSDWSASGESDVDAEGNDITAWDVDGAGGGTSLWVRNTQQVCLDTWDNQNPVTTDAGVTRNVYLLLNPGQLFASGKMWSADFQFDIQANT